jgi:hypothetical protein
MKPFRLATPCVVTRLLAEVLALSALFVATGDAEAATSCLKERKADLAELVMVQPLAPRSGGSKMVPITRGSPRWMAAFNAILAWENDDCEAFAAFTEKMGYAAVQVLDSVTNTRHWLVVERSPGNDSLFGSTPGEERVDARSQRFNGVFILRAPKERAHARRLIINAPHFGYDFKDNRAIQLYRQLGATALLQNSAHRCNLDACSGCGGFPGYACGGCPRISDAAHSVDNLMFAIFAALEGTRTHDGATPWLHFEYHGMATRPQSSPALATCAGIGEVSQGSTVKLTVAADEGSYANRFWRGLQKRLGAQCVCYHQRQSGCLLPGTHSVFGRLVNQESPVPFDPCTQEATRLSGRYIHFEWDRVPLETVAGALAEAVPQ